ncbi:motility associated factor glycosyltransferase family protein [Paenibacillus marinisediminis]
MDIYSNVIEERFPHLKSVIVDNEQIPESFKIVTSRDNRSNLAVHINGRHHYIYSNYNSEREVSMWLDQITDRVVNSKNILLKGLGLGYHLYALLEKFPEKKFYVYEPSQYLFSLAIHSQMLKEILKSQSVIDIAVGTEEIENRRFLDKFTEKVSDSFTELVIPSYEKMFEKEIVDFGELAVQITKMKRSNLATFSTFAQDWIDNILSNIKYITRSHGVNVLSNIFTNIPAVVVGSGPSLQYDIEQLRSIKDRVVIIAAGTSTQALLAAEIEPHIIVSMDGGEPNLRAFQSIATDHIPLVYGSFIHPGILNKNRSYTAYAIMDLDPITSHLLGNEVEGDKFKSNFSVTGLCVQLAALMGCHMIIFTGQDLSFPNRQYYTGGVNHINAELTATVLDDASMEVENVYGGKNVTNHGMYVTLRDIENLIGLFPHLQFVNASQNGAVIEGAPFQALCDIHLPETVDLNPDTVINALDRLTVKDMTNDVILQLDRDIQDLYILDHTLNKLLKVINRLKNHTNNRNELITGLNKVASLWSDISHNKAYRVYVNFGLSSVMNSYQRYIAEISEYADPKDKFKIIDNHLRSLSEKIIKFIPNVESSIRECVKDLRMDQSDQ